MINDIRVASNELYGINPYIQVQNSTQNTDFGQIIGDININKEDSENKINFSSLGAPAGFFADISMLDEADAKEIGIIQFDKTDSYPLH